MQKELERAETEERQRREEAEREEKERQEKNRQRELREKVSYSIIADIHVPYHVIDDGSMMLQKTVYAHLLA